MSLILMFKPREYLLVEIRVSLCREIRFLPAVIIPMGSLEFKMKPDT
jgi:hypothetical protein